jgi:hypothetical protein
LFRSKDVVAACFISFTMFCADAKNRVRWKILVEALCSLLLYYFYVFVYFTFSAEGNRLCLADVILALISSVSSLVLLFPGPK